MTRLTTLADAIELASYDTQLLITDLTDGNVEIYLEHDQDNQVTDFAVGDFKPEEVRALAEVLYARYVRGDPHYGDVRNFDA